MLISAAVWPPRWNRLRAAFVGFMAQLPGRKFRHEKVDVTTLLQKKDEDYVDISQVAKQHSKYMCTVCKQHVIFGSRILIHAFSCGA